MATLVVYGLEEAPDADGEPTLTHRRIEVALAALLPEGYAWDREHPTLRSLVAALSTELSRVDRRATKLVEDETNPLTTFELLPAFEEMLGLPDCEADETLAARRLAVAARLLAVAGHDHTWAFYKALWPELTYKLVGSYGVDCLGECIEQVSGDEWAATMELHVEHGDADGVGFCVFQKHYPIDVLVTQHFMWDQLTTGGTSPDLYAIASATNGYTIAVGAGGIILRAAGDLNDWAEMSSPTATDLTAVVSLDLFGAPFWVIGGVAGIVWWSVDNGENWTEGPDLTFSIRAMCRTDEDDGYVVAGCDDGKLFYSDTVGLLWDPSAEDGSNAVRGLCYTAGAIVAVGEGGECQRSLDKGVNFGAISTGVATNLRAVASWGSTVIAVGDGGVILRSTDAAATWAPITSPTSADLNAIAMPVLGRWSAAGAGGVVIQSDDDGVTWVVRQTTVTKDIYGGGFFVPEGLAAFCGADRTIISE